MTAARAVGFATEMLTAVNSTSFPERLINALMRVADFNIFSVTLFRLNAEPQFLFENLHDFTTHETIQNYCKATYMFDAVYTSCCHDISDGLYRLSDIAPDEFVRSEYYNSSTFHPCISMSSGSLAEEIVYITRLKKHRIVLSLMRAREHGVFDSVEFAMLSDIGPIVREATKRHWSFLDTDPTSQGDVANVDAMEAALSAFATDRLSTREKTIVTLLLRGHSVLSIGSLLGITEGTVKNHRKSIYRKLSISSQAELFLRLCRFIIAAKE